MLYEASPLVTNFVRPRTQAARRSSDDSRWRYHWGMRRRTVLELLIASPLALAQDVKAPDLPAPDYVCPMDPDVRSTTPGSCPRCGMKLVLGIPDGTEYRVELAVSPRVYHAGDPIELAFTVVDPRTGKQVKRFEIVHEKLFHMFIVSQDLQYFVHDHPVFGADGVFRYKTALPKPGLYRILADIYPAGGTPQLIAKTVIVPLAAGERLSLPPCRLAPELGENHCANMDVQLTLDPPEPIAGMKTMLFFKLKPGRGPGEIPGRLGAYVSRQRRPDRPDSHPSVYGGWRAAGAVQCNLPASPDLSGLGTVSAPGASEHSGVQCARE